MMRCVSCNSNEIKKISAVISQGTKEVDLGHGFLGIGASKQGLSIGGARGKTGGTITSGLSKKFKKRIPKKPTQWFMVFSGFALIFGCLTVWEEGLSGWVSIIFSFLFCGTFYNMHNKEQKKYEEEYDKFKRLWYCFACNDITIEGKVKKTKIKDKKIP